MKMFKVNDCISSSHNDETLDYSELIDFIFDLEVGERITLIRVDDDLK